MSLSNKQLILLDTLDYYSAFSNYMARTVLFKWKLVWVYMLSIK